MQKFRPPEQIKQGLVVDSPQVKTADRGLGVHRFVRTLFYTDRNRKVFLSCQQLLEIDRVYSEEDIKRDGSIKFPTAARNQRLADSL
jgi:hypothetical protein